MISRLRRSAILGFVFSLALGTGCGGGSREERDPLAAALAALRPGEGRLVGAPWREPASASEAHEKVVRSAARAAARSLEERVTADTLRNNAVLKLLAGNVDPAIAGLTRASDLAPSNAMIWSDLAAAHLQRSTVASDPYELILALAAANRAVRHDPKLPTGRFNRALALERLSLRMQAAAEWQLLSPMEGDPLWAREIRTSAARLARQTVPRDWQRDLSAVRQAIEQGKPEKVRAIVAGSPQGFREHLEEQLLPAWAVAESERRESDAARELAVARAIADALVSAGGDRMAVDTIAQIDRTRASDPGRFRRLVAGFLAYSEGMALTADTLYSEARPHFEEAQEALARVRSPFVHWTVYRIALCHYQFPAYQQARDHLQKLMRDPASTPYRALRGRALMLTGLIEGIEGRYAASITSLKSAEAAFREAKEAPYAARASALLGAAFDILGQREEAWRWLYAALTEPASYDKPQARLSICSNASWLAQREGETEIALWFQDEMVRNARAIGPEILAAALHQHISLLATLGRQSEAARQLEQARSLLKKISDPSLRRNVEGDLLLAEAEIAGTTSPRQSIARLDGAIRIYSETSYRYRLGHALYQRALAEKNLGQLDAAERNLAAAVAELERQREGAAVEDRISYFDRVKEVFDTMIELQLEQRRRPGEALRFSEQAKARVLWDWIVTSPAGESGPSRLKPSQPFDLQTIRRDLPAGTAVIEYAVLPRKTVLWIFRREGELQHQTVEIGERGIEDLVQRFRRALLENRSQDFEALSEQAYDLLIRPVARHLAPGERLVLIPDGALHLVPFSLLRNRQTRDHLIQERALTVAPSARIYAASRQRDRTLTQSVGQVLVVTSPDFDQDIDPTLPLLKAGDTEASIARIFPGSRVFRGAEATREAFLRASGDFAILHFGGHSVVNVNFPLLSQMLFAKDPADPARGVLYSGDVLRQRFPRTRLVVLASCGTALGKISRTEGVQNLARPFLAAGVPTVVASLWDVDDQTTADFFVRFYQHLKQRPFDVAGALQATQIESIERGSGPAASPRVWGAFEVIGGDRFAP